MTSLSWLDWTRFDPILTWILPEFNRLPEFDFLMTSYLTLKKDIERRLKGAWNFKWFKVTFQLILPFFASSLFQSRNILKSPEKKSMILIGRPGYNNDDVIISRRLALKVADHWHHTYTIVGWRLRSLIGRFPEKPRNYPKRNFNRWKPFSYEFVIAADSHIQTFIEVKTSGSTSGRKIYFRLETNREKIHFRWGSQNENYTACYSAFIVFRLPSF